MCLVWWVQEIKMETGFVTKCPTCKMSLESDYSDVAIAASVTATLMYTFISLMFGLGQCNHAPSFSAKGKREHFLDLILMKHYETKPNHFQGVSPKFQVLLVRQNVLRIFLFFLNDSAFLCASFPI